MCENPPGYESLEVISNKYPLVDKSYQAVMPWKLPYEGYGDHACIGRVNETLNGLIERFPGFCTPFYFTGDFVENLAKLLNFKVIYLVFIFIQNCSHFLMV